MTDDTKARFLCVVVAYVLFGLCVSWRVTGVLMALHLFAAAIYAPPTKK